MFEIFREHSKEDILWLEGMPSLADAMKRMEKIAAQTPGAYFIYCTSLSEVVGCVDNRGRGLPKTKLVNEGRKTL
jgi:hypothetical protein